MQGCKCKLATHPLIEDINEMLRSDSTHGAIRAFVVEGGQVPPERHQLSRHALKCLGLEPRSTGNPRTDEAETPDEELPPLEEIGELALRVFYQRLKKRPDDVRSSDLIPLVKLYLESISKESRTSDLEERLAQLANKNP